MLEEGEPETLVYQNPEGYVGLASQAHGPGFQVPHLLQLLECERQIAQILQPGGPK